MLIHPQIKIYCKSLKITFFEWSPPWNTLLAQFLTYRRLEVYVAYLFWRSFWHITLTPDLSGHRRTSTTSSRWALPDLNCELQISVGTAGPQSRAPDLSGHCQTSTGSSRYQWHCRTARRQRECQIERPRLRSGSVDWDLEFAVGGRKEGRKEGRQEGREGKGREGKGREGKGREGKGRDGTGREGEGKGREGREGGGRK